MQKGKHHIVPSSVIFQQPDSLDPFSHDYKDETVEDNVQNYLQTLQDYTCTEVAKLTDASV